MAGAFNRYLIMRSFGFQEAITDLASAYEGDDDNASTIIRMVRYALHFQVCVFIKDNREDCENLEGIDYAMVASRLEELNVVGSFPDLLLAIENPDGSKRYETIEVTITMGNLEQAIERKLLKSTDAGRPYDHILAFQFQTGEMRQHGSFVMEDVWKVSIKSAITECWTKCMDQGWSAEQMREAMLRLEETFEDCFGIKEEIQKIQMAGVTIDNLLDPIADAWEFEEAKPPTWPTSQERKDMRTYHRNIFQVTTGLHFGKRWELIKTLEVGEPIYFPFHDGIHRWKGKATTVPEFISYANAAKVNLEEIVRTIADGNDYDLYRPCRTIDSAHFLGRGGKPSPRGEYKMREYDNKNDFGLVDAEGLKEHWLEKVRTVTPERHDDKMRAAEEGLHCKWAGTRGYSYLYAARVLCENILGTSMHLPRDKKDRNECKIYPAAFAWDDEKDCITGYAVIQQSHFVSQGNHKNPGIMKIAFSEGPEPCEHMWNYFMFTAKMGGKEGIVYVNHSTMNTNKAANLCLADRFEILVAGRITAELVSSKTPENKLDDIRDEDFRHMISDESMVEHAWILLQLFFGESSDEGMAPTLRNYAKGKVARRFGWKPLMIDNEKASEKMADSCNSPLGPFHYNVAVDIWPLPFQPWYTRDITREIADTTIPGRWIYGLDE